MHELDITDGEASFVSAREDAWHGLGTTLPDTFTAEEAMTAGHLGGWNVRKVPLLAQVGAAGLPMPDRCAVVRDNPVHAGQVDVLGTVGANYTIVQNEAHAGLLNALVDESGAHFETAGALRGGRQVFITMKLPEHVLVGGVDQVETYLAAINSHDGSMALTAMVTPVRIRCKNTLNLAFGAASHVFRVRHTSGAELLMRQQARQALEMTFTYLKGFLAEADRMVQQTLTDIQFEEILVREYGSPDDAAKGTVTRAENRIGQIMDLFSASPTQANIRGTVWAGLNAITEWADHFSPVRGLEIDRDVSRAQKAVLDPSFKDRALQIMQAVA